MRTRKRSKKRSFPWRQVGVFALVGGLAILCGWAINTLLVQGYLWAPIEQPDPPGTGVIPAPDPNPEQPDPDPGPGEEPPPETTADVNLRAVSFHLTQVGAVGSETGARALINDLEQQGFAGAYHYDGQLYRVFAGIFADKGAADALSVMLKSLQIDAFAKEISWPAGQGRLTGAAGGYFEVVKGAVTTLEDTFASLLGTQAVDISTLQSSLQAAQSTLSQTQPTSEVAELHRVIVAAADKLQGAVDGVRLFIDTGNDHSRITSEARLIEFAALYQRFVNEIRVLLS